MNNSERVQRTVMQLHMCDINCAHAFTCMHAFTAATATARNRRNAEQLYISIVCLSSSSSEQSAPCVWSADFDRPIRAGTGLCRVHHHARAREIGAQRLRRYCLNNCNYRPGIMWYYLRIAAGRFVWIGERGASVFRAWDWMYTGPTNRMCVEI